MSCARFVSLLGGVCIVGVLLHSLRSHFKLQILVAFAGTTTYQQHT